MSFNRMMMMKKGEDLKNIKAMMTVSKISGGCGFKNELFGSLSPNPLPNGVLVTGCYVRLDTSDRCILAPSSIKSCTINNITVSNGAVSKDLYSYLNRNLYKTIPVIFHFD